VAHTDVGAGYGNNFAPMMTSQHRAAIGDYYTQAPKERLPESIRNVTQAAVAFSMGSHAQTLPAGTGPIKPDTALGSGNYARLIDHARSLIGGTRLVVRRTNGTAERVSVYDNYTAEFPLDLSKLTHFAKDTNGAAYPTDHTPHHFSSTFNFNDHPDADYAATVNRLIWDAAASTSASALEGDDLSTAFPVLKPVNSGAQYELLMGFTASINFVHALIEQSDGNLCLNEYATSFPGVDIFDPAKDPAFYVPADPGAPAYVIVLPIKLLFQQGGGWRKGTDIVGTKEILAFASNPGCAIDMKFEPLPGQYVPVHTDFLGMIGDTVDLALRFYPSGLLGFYDRFVAQEKSIGSLLDSHGTDLARYPAQYELL
jgi:hypothetical protein